MKGIGWTLPPETAKTKENKTKKQTKYMKQPFPSGHQATKDGDF